MFGLPLGVLFLVPKTDSSKTEWTGSFAVASVIVLGVFSVAVLGLAAWSAYLEHLKNQAKSVQRQKTFDDLIDQICKEIRRFPEPNLSKDKAAQKPAEQKIKSDQEKLHELIELIKSTRKHFKTKTGATEAEQNLLRLFEDLKKLLFPAQEETITAQAAQENDKENIDSKNS